ncbi:MAG: acyl-CoA dehydrogenase family protein [Sandaracinaceae bacterium]
MQNFQSERLIGSTSALAGARRALDRSVAYGRERKAFGKPIMAREVWKHTFADLYTKAQAAHALCYDAVEDFNEERYVKGAEISFETVKKIAMCKLFVGDVSSEIMDTCLQFHGGMGYLEDLWVARAWRDARLFRIGGGTSEVMKYMIAKIMGW